jgi:hypothetical protein
MNVKALVYLSTIREVVPHMAIQGGGRIIAFGGPSRPDCLPVSLPFTLAPRLAPAGFSPLRMRGVDASLVVQIAEDGAIAHQTAGEGVVTQRDIAGSAWQAASAARRSVCRLKKLLPLTRIAARIRALPNCSSESH